MKSNFYCISILFTLIFFISCENNDFLKFDSNDILFQIIPKKEGILCAKNTEGEGARKLQLYCTNGNLLEEITIHNEPFKINKWASDTIEIIFTIGDYMLFEPWFKTNEYKPTKINNYNIIYTYRIISTINPSTSYDIDSFYINRNNHKVVLFSHKKVIKEILVEELLVNTKRFVYVNFDKGMICSEEFKCQDQNIIKKYINEILKLY